MENYGLAITLFLFVLVSPHCHVYCCNTDHDCHTDTMVCSKNSTNISTSPGTCQCKVGLVAWKWECYPRVAIGEGCVASVQCTSQVNPTAVCNPFTHQCSCGPGHVPARAGPPDIGLLVCREETVKKPLKIEEIITVYQPPKNLARPKKIPKSSHNFTELLIESAVKKALANAHPIQGSDPNQPMLSNSKHNYSQSAMVIESAVRQSLSPHNYSESLITSAVAQALAKYLHQSPNPSPKAQSKSPDDLSNPLIETAVRKALNMSSALPLINEKDRSLVDSLMIIGMLMVGLGIAGVITTLYIRALQEKKMSQAALNV